MRVRLEGGPQGPIDVEVDQDKLANTGILQYQAEFYVFSKLDGPFFTRVVFTHVQPPLEVFASN